MSIICVKDAMVLDAGSPFNGQRKDIIIENGIISRIGNNFETDGMKVISGNGLFVSPGWFDMRVNFWDPGFEYKEDLESGCEAAAYGGFTSVALLPETEPQISGKAQVEYIKSKSANNIVNVYPTATISQKKDEQVLSEMQDLCKSGAVAFSSGYRAVPDEGFLLRALLYSGNISCPLILIPENKSIAGKGMMNEGLINVQLGLKGIPVLAEEVELHKIISLCRYSGTRVHISGISSALAVKLLQNAKEEGLPITADVYMHQLYFTENDLLDFNTNLKLRPPLRATEDQLALRNAVLEGVIDCVVSNHTPHEDDSKRCEFDIAAFGATGVQTVFSQFIEVFGKDSINLFLQTTCINPRRILNIAVPEIKEGFAAELTVFDLNAVWKLDDKSNKSKSRNTPFWNAELKGRAVAIINKGNVKVLN